MYFQFPKNVSMVREMIFFSKKAKLSVKNE